MIKAPREQSEVSQSRSTLEKVERVSDLPMNLYSLINRYVVYEEPTKDKAHNYLKEFSNVVDSNTIQTVSENARGIIENDQEYTRSPDNMTAGKYYEQQLLGSIDSFEIVPYSKKKEEMNAERRRDIFWASVAMVPMSSASPEYTNLFDGIKKEYGNDVKNFYPFLENLAKPIANNDIRNIEQYPKLRDAFRGLLVSEICEDFLVENIEVSDGLYDASKGDLFNLLDDENVRKFKNLGTKEKDEIQRVRRTLLNINKQVKFASAIDTPIDYIYGVDAVVFFGNIPITIDVSLHKDVNKTNADILFLGQTPFRANMTDSQKYYKEMKQNVDYLAQAITDAFQKKAPNNFQRFMSGGLQTRESLGEYRGVVRTAGYVNQHGGERYEMIR